MIGLRMRSISLTLGTSFDYFFPDEDMPDEVNDRGYDIFEDIHTTPTGNTYMYEKGKRKVWGLEFKDISSVTKNALEHMTHGWQKKKQITVVYFGTHVTGTNQSPGTYSSSQIWGTGFVRLNGLPKESAFDLWNTTIIIREFGPDQNFT